MDQSRLNSLTRFVARRTRRRGLAAGALGSLLVALTPGLSVTDAAKKTRKKATCKKPKRKCRKQCINPKTSRQHCGRCNHKCKPGQSCRQGTCTPPQPPKPCGQGGPCRVFITSTTTAAYDLDGLTGGDDICSNLAQEAGLPGTYRAWLSNVFGSPASRFHQNQGPYVLTNGTRVANNWADLTNGSLLAPLTIMENGQPYPETSLVWTGTEASGTWSGPELDCNGWYPGPDTTGTTGAPNWTTSRWTSDSFAPSPHCSWEGRLYCFQQP